MMQQQITFKELAQRYPSRNVAPYGICVVIPGNEFDPDWEVYLSEEGCRCINTDLDKRVVTLVKRNKVEKVNKVTERSAPEADNPLKRPNMHSPEWRWKPEEDELITKLWNRNLPLVDIYLQVRDVFSNRSDMAIQKRIYVLQKRGVISKRYSTPRSGKSAVAQQDREGFWRPEEDKLLMTLWKAGLTIAEISVEIHKRFPHREGTSVKNRLQRLRKAGKIQSKKRGGSRKKAIRKTSKAPEIGSGPEHSKTAEAALNVPIVLEKLTKDVNDILTFLEGHNVLLSKLWCIVKMQELEVHERRGILTIPPKLLDAYADAISTDNEENRAEFIIRASKLLEASR